MVGAGAWQLGERAASPESANFRRLGLMPGPGRRRRRRMVRTLGLDRCNTSPQLCNLFFLHPNVEREHLHGQYQIDNIPSHPPGWLE